MVSECRLTTTDNPFDPFDQFTSWFLFDVGKGYNSCAYLARILDLNLSNDDNESINSAIDEIIKNDFLGIYKKVYRNSEKTIS